MCVFDLLRCGIDTLLHPFSLGIVLWTVFVDLSRSAFQPTTTCGFQPLDYVSLIIDSVFVLDILLNLFLFGTSGPLGDVELRHKRCVMNYVKQRMWFDVPTSIPVYW